MTATFIMGHTRGGREWIPKFVIKVDQSLCIGCGRCYKACPRDVFELVDRKLDDVEDEDDSTAKVMSIADALDCIGCTACANACPKGCLSHAPSPAA